VQRPLSDAESTDLIRRYRAGASIDGLARELDVHRSTLINHLDRAGVPRRRVPRKMTNESVARAAARYQEGVSLAVVSNEFGAHARALARELRRAGEPIRRRPGWAP
jgi:transposase-like protein